MYPHKSQFFQGFLQKFQTNKPMVPFLESALVDLLHTLMKMVVKSEVLDEANSSLKLAKLDLSNSENLLLCELMKLPTATKSLLRSAGLSNEKRRLFWKNCKEVVVVLIKKIQDRCPLKYAVARCAASLSPLNMVNDKCVNYFDRLVDKLYNLKWITAKDADEAKEYFKFITAVQNERMDTFLAFDENKVRLDSFFCDFMHGNNKFRKCWDVVKLVFTLSHGQAPVERGFSVNKELQVENLQQLSLVSQRIVSNYLTDFGKSITKVPLTNAFLKSCQLAHSRYATALEMNKNEAHAQEKDRKRKLKIEEIAEVKEKKRALEAAIQSLETDTEKYSFAAEKESNLTLLTKANSFRVTVREKKETLSSLENVFIKLNEEQKQI